MKRFEVQVLVTRHVAILVEAETQAAAEQLATTRAREGQWTFSHFVQTDVQGVQDVTEPVRSTADPTLGDGDAAGDDA